jgi:hypothetical protein
MQWDAHFEEEVSNRNVAGVNNVSFRMHLEMFISLPPHANQFSHQLI